MTSATGAKGEKKKGGGGKRSFMGKKISGERKWGFSEFYKSISNEFLMNAKSVL